MHVAATRLITRWLKHSTYGVNKLIQTLPRQKINGQLDPKPPTIAIYNDVDFDDMITTGGLVPPEMPALVVVTDENSKNPDLKSTKKFASGHWLSGVTGIGFYAEHTDSKDDIVLGDLVLRATGQSLVRFNKAPQVQRQLNGFLVAIEAFEIQRVAPAVPQSNVLGILFADLVVLDKAP